MPKLSWRLAKERIPEFAGSSDELTGGATAKQQAATLLQRHSRGLNARLRELAAAKTQATPLLQPQEATRTTAANDSAIKELAKILTRVQDPAILLPDKDEL